MARTTLPDKDQVNVRMSTDLAQALEAEARRRGVTVSQVVRWAVMDYLRIDPSMVGRLAPPVAV